MRVSIGTSARAGLSLLLAALFQSQSLAFQAPPPQAANPPAQTISIVAVDDHSGEIGVAVLSHWFSVGSLVVWAEAGVGAVATQGFYDPAYGPRGLEEMRKGASAEKALGRLLRKDENAALRQIAFVDAEGEVDAYTGKLTIAHACDTQGWGFSVQANAVSAHPLAEDSVCDVAAALFEQSGEKNLAVRMLAALEAADAANGVAGGRRSAAIRIVGNERRNNPWEGRLMDLRVENHESPLAELARLVRVNRALNLMRRGEAYLDAGRPDEAAISFDAAQALAPDHAEILFWRAAALAAAGRVDESLPYFRQAFADDAGWRELISRIPPNVVLPDDPEVIDRIRALSESGDAK